MVRLFALCVLGGPCGQPGARAKAEVLADLLAAPKVKKTKKKAAKTAPAVAA